MQVARTQGSEDEEVEGTLKNIDSDASTHGVESRQQRTRAGVERQQQSLRHFQSIG